MSDTSLQKQLDDQRSKVDVDHYDLPVREIIRMVAEKELLRAPEYQRRFRWSSEDRSRLIESLFLGLPVPSIFVATNTDSTWELVDGLQRVSTLIHYAADPTLLPELIGEQNPLTLQHLSNLSLFNGKAFHDLPTAHQLAFYRRFIRVTALSDKSDPVVRFELFDRLNRGGITLTPQEVRACSFRGHFSEFLRELAETPRFVNLVKLQSQRQNDGTREELVLKFFAYLYRRSKFKGAVRKFLDDYMRDARDKFEYAENRRLFFDVLEHLTQALAGTPFLRERYGVTPQNQLEATMVGIAEVIRSGSPVSQPPCDWPNDEELVKHSTKGTNTQRSLHGRIDRAIKLFSDSPS